MGSATNLTPEDAEGSSSSRLVVLAPRRSRLSAEPGDERDDLGYVDPHCLGRQYRRVRPARVPPDLHAAFECRVRPPPGLGTRGTASRRRPGLTAGGETHAAQFSRWGLGRRSIPAKQPVMKPTRPSSPGGASAGDPSRLTASLRAAHRCVSVEIHPGQFSRWGLLPHAPCQPGVSPPPGDWPASALTRVPPPAVHRVASSRRSSLRFGRNTLGPVLPVGAPPSRALSAGPPPGELGLAPTGRLASLGAHPGSTTGC